MRILFASIVAALIVPLAGFAQDGPPDLMLEPQIEIEGMGTLRTETGEGEEGFLAIFESLQPATKSCSGRCGDRWSGSWTCPDNKSCYLNCSSTDPGQCM